MLCIHACARAWGWGPNVHVSNACTQVPFLFAPTRLSFSMLCPFPGRARIVRLGAADVAQGAELETRRQMCACVCMRVEGVVWCGSGWLAIHGLFHLLTDWID